MHLLKRYYVLFDNCGKRFNMCLAEQSNLQGFESVWMSKSTVDPQEPMIEDDWFCIVYDVLSYH